MKRIFILTVILIQCLNYKGQSQWVQTNGPYYWNKYIYSIAIRGDNIFAGGNGMYYSSYHGLNWSQLDVGNNFINKIICLEDITLAATLNGLYLSTDNGQNWSRLSNGISTGEFKSILVIEDNIFAGSYGNGVFRSTDNGTSWSSINTGLTSLYVRALGNKEENVLVATNVGVFLSSNNGENWISRNSGLEGQYVNTICANGNDIFVGTGYNGIYYSSNDGLNWLHRGLTSFKQTISVAQNNIFAGGDGGVFLSTDNGISWSQRNNGLKNLAIHSSAISGDTVFIGNDEGVHISTNNGLNWLPFNDGFTCANVGSIGILGNKIFVGTSSGLYLSSNEGQNWTNLTSYPENFVRKLTITGDNIFAGSGDDNYLNYGVYRSTDDGYSWTQLNNGLPTANYIIFSMASSEENIFIGGDAGIYRSTDYGAVWVSVNGGLSSSEVYAISINGEKIFIGTDEGVFLSLNNGSNWTLVNNNLPNTEIHSIISFGDYVIAGGWDIYLSTNNGTTWSTVCTVGWLIESLCAINNNIFAACYAAGVYRSIDYGFSWEPINDSLSVNYAISLASNEQNLLLGTGYYSLGGTLFSNGVWRRPLSEIVDVGNEKFIFPAIYSLIQNYPNPFNPTTTIAYQIPQREFVTLKVYDILGREIATLVNEEKPAGNFEVQFSGNELTSGIYFYQIKAGDYSETKKMILLR